MKKAINELVEIPEGIEVEIKENKVTASSGDKKTEREFGLKNIELSKKGDEIIIISKKGSKSEGKMIGTLKAHLRNMFKGLKEPFVYKLAIEYVHFPMTVEMDSANNRIKIKNFLGEKNPRYCKIVDGAEIKIEKNEITVSSHNKEIAGQAAANFEKATRIKGKDRRKFQDGIYITEKAGKLI